MKIKNNPSNMDISQVMLSRFIDAVKGDVVRYVDLDNKPHYVALAYRNVPEKGINQKEITLYNLETGYVWRDGGTNNREAFTKYFKDSKGNIIIKDLVVYRNATLTL